MSAITLIQPIIDFLGYLVVVIMVCGGVVGAATVFGGMFIKVMGWRI